MSKKTDRMYGNSPKIGRGEDGKVEVKREKKSQQVAAGTDGMQEHDSKMLDMGHKHEKEHLELNQKHEKERHELRAKQMKDGAMKAGSEPEGEDKKEENKPGDGESKIKKIEKTEKE